MYHAAVLTVSDRVSRGERPDEGGPLVAELLKNAGYEVVRTDVVPDEQAQIEAALELFNELCGVLGLVYHRESELLDADIEALIEQRTEARKAKNFVLADQIRDELKEKGILLEDSATGVKWRRV